MSGETNIMIQQSYLEKLNEASKVSWPNVNPSVSLFSHIVNTPNFLVCFCQLIYDGLCLFIMCFHEVFGSKVAHYILPCHSTWLIGPWSTQWLIQASLTNVGKNNAFCSNISRQLNICWESWSATKSIKSMEIRFSFYQIAVPIQNNL